MSPSAVHGAWTALAAGIAAWNTAAHWRGTGRYVSVYARRHPVVTFGVWLILGWHLRPGR